MLQYAESFQKPVQHTFALYNLSNDKGKNKGNWFWDFSRRVSLILYPETNFPHFYFYFFVPMYLQSFEPIYLKVLKTQILSFILKVHYNNYSGGYGYVQNL